MVKLIYGEKNCSSSSSNIEHLSQHLIEMPIDAIYVIHATQQQQPNTQKKTKWQQ